MSGHVGNSRIFSWGWAWGSLNTGATPSGVWGLQAPEIQIQGGEKVEGLKVSQHWDQISWSAAGQPRLPWPWGSSLVRALLCVERA